MNSVRKGKCPTDVSPKETELKCGLKASRGKTGGLAYNKIGTITVYLLGSSGGVGWAGREACHDTYRNIIFITDAV